MDVARATRRISFAGAAQVCGPPARVLINALENETNDTARWSLVCGLASVSIRLAPEEAANAVRVVFQTAAKLVRLPEEQLNKLHQLLSYEQMGSADATRSAELIMAALDHESDPDVRWCLAAGIASVAVEMKPDDAARICGPVLPHFAAALVQKGDYELPTGWRLLATGLRAVSSHNPNHVSQAARIMTKAIAAMAESNDTRFGALVSGLGAIADRIPRPEAAEAVRVLRPILADERGTYSRTDLIGCLAKCAGRLPVEEAAKLLDQLARMQINAFKSKPGPSELDNLVERLTPLVERMNTADAARACAQAVEVISDVYERDPESLLPTPGPLRMGGSGTDPDPLRQLVILAGWVKADQAMRLCTEVIRTFLKKAEPTNRRIIESLPQLDAVTANKLARELALLVCSDKNLDVDKLSAILIDVGRPRPVRPSSNTLPEAQNPTIKPLPCRLTTQELVELLKMPTCFGAARRVVLNHLGSIHGRRFTNHWEFVRFAREKGLQLDLTTSPRRPNREESIKRMLAILDGKS